MREPARIVASLEMATQLREALERATKEHDSAGWTTASSMWNSAVWRAPCCAGAMPGLPR